MRVIVSGILICCKDAHLKNAAAPKLVTELGI